MTTKILISFLLAILFSNCKFPEYLPSTENIDTNPHGAMITAHVKKSSGPVRGELISCDDDKLIILADSAYAKKKGTKLERLSWEEVNKFRLQYAKPKNYAWSLPVYTLATLSHGLFAIFTAPVNFAATFTVNNSGRLSFSYDNTKISMQDISMFARYPQGIPPGIDPDTIK